MKGEKTNNGTSTELGQLHGRFEQWRRQTGQGRRRRIPETLWAEAAGMARQHGVFKVARTLRLDYATLKERAGVKTGRRRKPLAMPFVEVMMASATAAKGSSHCSVIELIHRNGARMTLRLEPYCVRDLVALAEAFLRRAK